MILLYIDPGTGGMLFSILFGLIGVVSFFFRSLIIKLRYGSGKAEKLDADNVGLVVFSDHKRYWNIFEPILNELELRELPVTYYTMSEDDPGLNADYNYVKCEFIGSGNKAFARMNTLRADIVLSTTPSLDVFQWKRSKYVRYYVHIPHAPSDITLYHMFGIDYYDSILLSGEYQARQVRRLEEIRKLPQKEICYVGIPYMDSMKKRLASEPIQDSDSRVVLLAPSWGKSSLLNVYGKDLIDALIDTGYHIIIRPHPQSYTSETDLLDSLMAEYPDGIVEWNRDNDNFDVLCRSDILISDFSGVIFDFALVYDKPIIYADTSFDTSPYDCYQIDDEIWTFSVLPKIGIKLDKDDLSDIKAVIDNCIDNPSFGEARDEARTQTWLYPGEGAVRAADYLFEKWKEIKLKESDK